MSSTGGNGEMSFDSEWSQLKADAAGSVSEISEMVK